MKHRAEAPEGFFAAEAAGLSWLADAAALPVVEVLAQDRTSLTLPYLEAVAPTSQQVAEFGAGLARLHAAGAEAFGWAPAEKAWFGPLANPTPISTTPRSCFAEFWTQDRLLPVLEKAAPTLGAARAALVRKAVEVIATGLFDGIAGSDPVPPARVHGDLWAGNVIWTETGGVLIDPVAHGGHPFEDIAMLDMFGAPHQEVLLSAYAHEAQLPMDWEDDIPAHQLHGILAHVVLFGTAYIVPAERAAEATLRRARHLSALA